MPLILGCSIYSREMVNLCLYTNTIAMPVGKGLRKWFVFQKPTFYLLVQSAKAKIRERKFRQWLLLERHFQVEVQPHLAVVVDPAAVFPEQVNCDAGRELAFYNCKRSQDLAIG